jgi:hypothetical protein
LSVKNKFKTRVVENFWKKGHVEPISRWSMEPEIFVIGFAAIDERLRARRLMLALCAWSRLQEPDGGFILFFSLTVNLPVMMASFYFCWYVQIF